jgi:signal transduction histidine kinase
MRLDQRPVEFPVKRLLGPLLLGATVWLLPGLGHAGWEPQKNVLLLYSQRSDLEANIVVDRTIRSALEEVWHERLDCHSEYIDTIRFPEEDYQLALRDFLRRKYARQKIDVIIAVADTALRFVRAYGSELFPGTPVVSWSGRAVIADWGAGPPVTGVMARIDLKGTLEFILRLQPGTRQVIVLSGASQSDRYYEELARREFREYEGRVALTYLPGLPLENVRKQVANLPAKTAILFLNIAEDGTGKKLLTHMILPEFTRLANAPVYGIAASQLEYGIVGGSLLNQEALARETADVALRILRGEPIENVPILESNSTVPMVSWRQLRRWGISEARLPLGTIVRYKEPSILDLYKWHIIGVISLCATEAALIAGLLVHRAKRRRAEEVMRQVNVELEQRVSQRTAELQAKTHELETFAYSVAHDLKAPLRGIDGYSRLLLEDYSEKLNEEGRTFLHTIRSSTVRMNQLIEDLLAYSRLERRPLASSRINPRSLIEALVEEKSNELKQTGASLTVDVTCEDVTVDPDGMAQALRNLLDNAIKFSRSVPAPRIEIIAKCHEQSCRIWVRDNGVGFDMKYHDRIFELFQCLHPMENHSGTGVGLAIVRKAMDRMGGRVWAESAPGRGATFYLEVPR